MIGGSLSVTSSAITALPPSLPAYLPLTLAFKTVKLLFAVQNRIKSEAEPHAERAHLQPSDDDDFLAPLVYVHHYESILANMSNDMRLLYTVVCELVTRKLKDDYFLPSPLPASITCIFTNEVGASSEIVQKVVVEVVERGERTYFFDYCNRIHLEKTHDY